MSFQGFGGNRTTKGRQIPDCECLTCDREFHHLGIMRHRAMHRDRNEDCRIMFSDGRVIGYRFASPDRRPEGA